nr:Lrp/AsnC family transcriptional regulator [Psychrobacter sp. PraFG1]UNK04567.1 Lrp/AsnC family transcriptional regulator [Psychrobacter sp. PraFG1]
MDDIDKNIIMLLKENSRIPVSLIAQKVGRSRTVVAKRIDELVNSGEISKFTVQLKQKNCLFYFL